MRVLIDADWLLHVAAKGNAVDLVYDDEIVTTYLNLKVAMRDFDSRIRAIMVQFPDASEVRLCSSDPSRRYFRHKIFPEYKGNRRSPLPCGYSALRKEVARVHGLHWIPELEADDVMGIIATDVDEAVIVSVDKDMKTVPCRLFNPDTVEHFTVSEEEADFNHLLQVLTGDRTDGVPGLKGFGPVKAHKALRAISGPRAQWERVLKEYAKAGLAEHDALKMARVLRILRAGDYAASGKLKLWEPAA